MTRLLAILALAGACVTSAPELTPDERRAGAAALQAWRESGLPPPVHCDLAALAVRSPDATGFWQSCRAMPDKSAGCVLWSGARPTIVVSPLHRGSDGLLVHEYAHVLFRCSRLDGYNGPANFGHLDPRVWEVGGPTGVHARAMRLLAD